jgi:hypothetical protein
MHVGPSERPENEHDTEGLRETVQTLPHDTNGASRGVGLWHKPQSRLSIGRFRVGLTKL